MLVKPTPPGSPARGSKPAPSSRILERAGRAPGWAPGARSPRRGRRPPRGWPSGFCSSCSRASPTSRSYAALFDRTRVAVDPGGRATVAGDVAQLNAAARSPSTRPRVGQRRRVDPALERAGAAQAPRRRRRRGARSAAAPSRSSPARSGGAARASIRRTTSRCCAPSRRSRSVLAAARRPPPPDAPGAQSWRTSLSSARGRAPRRRWSPRASGACPLRPTETQAVRPARRARHSSRPAAVGDEVLLADQRHALAQRRRRRMRRRLLDRDEHDQRVRPVRPRSRRATSMPSSPGIRRSQITSAGSSRSTAARASCPPAASPTASKPGVASITARATPRNRA